MFRGLGTLIQIATDLADRVHDDASVSSASSRAMYGVSVRVGGRRVRVAPRVTRPQAQAQTESTLGDAREPMADVFDEDDHFVIVAELPGVDEAAMRWNVRNTCLLVIRGEASDRKYHKEFELSAPVDEGTAVARYGNGVLELRLWKQHRR